MERFKCDDSSKSENQEDTRLHHAYLLKFLLTQQTNKKSHVNSDVNCFPVGKFTFTLMMQACNYIYKFYKFL